MSTLTLEPVATEIVSPPGRPGTNAGERRSLRWWRELVLVAAWYVGYEAVRAASPEQAGAARAHAHALTSIERWAHVAPERLLNRAVWGHPWLGVLSGYYYATLHFVVTPIVLIWLYWRHRPLYRRARTVLVGASAASLLLFWFYRVAPPRLASRGLHDIGVTVVALAGLAQQLLSSRRRIRTLAGCNISINVPAEQAALQRASLVPARAGRP